MSTAYVYEDRLEYIILYSYSCRLLFLLNMIVIYFPSNEQIGKEKLFILIMLENILQWY